MSFEVSNQNLTICFECYRMSAIPQGAFAVRKIKKNLKKKQVVSLANKHDWQKERDEESKSYWNFGSKLLLQEDREPTPLKYNSKLMNSIWGLYNRYSVHNFKKIDANIAGH